MPVLVKPTSCILYIRVTPSPKVSCVYLYRSLMFCMDRLTDSTPFAHT